MKKSLIISVLIGLIAGGVIGYINGRSMVDYDCGWCDCSSHNTYGYLIADKDNVVCQEKVDIVRAYTVGFSVVGAAFAFAAGYIFCSITQKRKSK